ncbi:hypothetical protein RJ40_09115 [Methanofollis aquaemaris]|uniref:Uncharacterized protein n=1 Tax=Methanofollis aquaemaris TaxID=126734 RepID=A0A8A3S7S8_9EURY|nr:hypothetical protein [Methanofollis aquaemaris]QSZ67656.1 hypothetical protein RJ40_09115 [Methanofollis aquaemaris]
MRVFRLFALVSLLFLCMLPAAATNMVPEGPISPESVIALVVFWLTLYCIAAVVFSAVVAGIYLLLECLPMPRVRAALPPLVLAFVAGAYLLGAFGQFPARFPLSILSLAMAVLTPWPVVASGFGSGRRPWVLVLIAAFTTTLLATALNFFPYVGGPGQVAYMPDIGLDIFFEIGETVCIACLVWAVMLLLGRLREGERVFLLVPLLVIVWVGLSRGAPSSLFPEGALIAGGVASVLLLAAAPLAGRRRVGALLLVVAAALTVAGGHALILTPGGEWATISVALFIVLMLALGTAAGLILIQPEGLPWCMGAAFAAPLLVALGYRLVGGNWWEIWERVGASLLSLLLLGAVSTLAAATIGGFARWAKSGKDEGPVHSE